MHSLATPETPSISIQRLTIIQTVSHKGEGINDAFIEGRTYPPQAEKVAQTVIGMALSVKLLNFAC
jgi:hypothetical protein